MAEQGPDGNGLQVSWANGIQTRNGDLSYDAKIVNGFIEDTANGKAVVKRPGTKYTLDTATGTAQGQLTVNGVPFYIVNDTAYQYSSNGAISFTIPNPSTAGLPYASLSVDVSGTTPYAVLNGAGSLFKVVGVTATRVTDTNLTSYQVQPGIAFLDGVFYVMELGGRVLGSAINDVTVWPALDFVQADATLGGGVTVSRHLNYLIAYYEHGLQVYYDANSAPNGQGTALGPVSSGTFRTGCAAPYSVVELDDNCIFVSQTQLYGRSVSLMNGLTLQSISTPYIDKILSNINFSGDQKDTWASGLKIDGHSFYILTCATLGVTLVFDLTEQQWYQWTSTVNGTEQYFVGRFYLNNAGAIAVGTVLGDYMQEVTTGRLINISATTFTDASGPLTVTCVTPNNDWGTLNWKRFGYMNQFADTVNTTVSVSYSDDDYQTWSTPRTIDLSTVRKQLRNCGSSRRRAWQLQHTDNTSLRVYNMLVNTTGMQR